MKNPRKIFSMQRLVADSVGREFPRVTIDTEGASALFEYFMAIILTTKIQSNIPFKLKSLREFVLNSLVFRLPNPKLLNQISTLFSVQVDAENLEKCTRADVSDTEVNKYSNKCIYIIQIQYLLSFYLFIQHSISPGQLLSRQKS